MALTHNEHLTFLNDHIPIWLERLSTIAHGIEERLTDSSSPRTSPRTPDCRPENPRLFLDSGNAITLATNKSRRIDGAQTPVSMKRKRTASSTESVQRICHNRYRAQNAKVVFYDASAQKLLEGVVDEIGNVKNMIRKEKAMARVRSYGRQVAHSSDGDDDDDDDLDDDTVMAQVRQRRKRTSEGVMRSSDCSSTNMENLDRIGKRLDCAVDMCSTAAYQLLRDGACRIEANCASLQLEDVWVIVKDELAYNLERSMEGTSRGPSSIEKEPTSHIQPRASIESEEDFPLAPIRLTSKLAPP